MRDVGIDSPNTAGFFVRALRKYAVVQLLTLDITGARCTLSEARCLARDYLIRDQVRVNRRSNLTPYRRPILTPLSGGF